MVFITFMGDTTGITDSPHMQTYKPHANGAWYFNLRDL